MFKMMISFLSLFLTLSAFAAESFSIHYSGNEGWGQSFYSCDYAQSQTEIVLELFGATEIEVSCSGGITHGPTWMPIHIRVRFELPVLVESSSVKRVTYKGDERNPACGLNVRIVKSLLKRFRNVQVINKSDSCAFYSSNYAYLFDITL